MGGLGSGQRWSNKKAVADGRTAIDVADLKRLNLLVPGTTNQEGSLHWRREGEDKPSSAIGYFLTVGHTEGAFQLSYKLANDPEPAYTIPLVTSPCHLGGVRWWFLCPLVVNGQPCRRRVRKLYQRGKYFGCRHCHQLTYASSQQSDSRVYAAVRSGAFAAPTTDVSNWSVAQLGFALKVLTFEQKRLNRLGKRSDRIFGQAGPDCTVEMRLVFEALEGEHDDDARQDRSQPAQRHPLDWTENG